MADSFTEIEMESGSESVQNIFSDVKLALRFADVPWLFRVLGEHEKFLAVAWVATKPLLTHGFDESADSIRAEAVALISETFTGSDLNAALGSAGLDSNALDEFVDTLLAYHFVDAKMLLISAALLDAVHDKPVGVQSVVVMPTGRGVPFGMPGIDRTGSSSAVSESASTSGIAAAPDFLKALSKWPAAADLVWKELKSAIGNPAHSAATEKTAVNVADAVAQFGRRMDLGKHELQELGIEESERSKIIEKLEAAFKMYLNSVVDVAHGTLLVAGPEVAAMTSEEMLLKWKLPRSA